MYFKTFLLAFAFVCTHAAGTAKAQKNGSDPQKVLDQYLDVAQALVKSDFRKSKIQASKLAEILKTTQNQELQAQGAALLMSNSLEEMRSGFSRLSTTLKTYFASATGLEEPLYIAHCPMAFNDTGAIWLTDEKRVVNPYFGMEMLHCGKIIGTIKPEKP